MNASILAIGTEITTGDIVNGNAAWIAEKLVDLGYQIRMHITVADHRDDIQYALAECTRLSPLVVITGGLGPTSDDFTRDEIAAFCKKELKWDEASWQHIIQRLTSLNAPISESNKQQCWFPEGSEILTNNQGTAAGFMVTTTTNTLLVLPGPPREIAAIWQDHVAAKLSDQVPPHEKLILKRWLCLGMSESKIGELVEDSLKGSGFTTGYRSTLPYIEVKVWIPTDELSPFQSTWQPALEASIGKWIVARDDEDLAKLAWDACPHATPIYITDRITGGLLAARLFGYEVPAGKQLAVLSCDYGTPMPPMPQACDAITITANIESGAWRIGLTGMSDHKEFTEVSRYKGAAHADRLKKYICERSLQVLIGWWS